MAGSHVNNGNVLRSIGKYEEALAQMQKGLEIQLKLLGSEHLLVADSLQKIVRECVVYWYSIQ